MLRPLPDPDSLSDALSWENKSDFYTLVNRWWTGDNVRTYIDDASRTFATILTSGKYCKFFDVVGKPVSHEEFTKKYNSYSGESFVVVINKEKNEFLIKPFSSRTAEILRKTKWKLKNLAWKKAA